MNATNPLAGLHSMDRGNVAPILNEVTHAIDRLLEDNEPTVIDLSSLPFAPGELDKLEAALGHGELEATLTALGISTIRETKFPGVWWLEHKNTDDEVVGRYIEITRAPDILRSQDADIQAGRAKLVADLAEHNEATQDKEALT